MQTLRKLYYKFIRIVESGLYVPTEQNTPLGAPIQETDAEQFFLTQQKRRTRFVEALLQFFPMQASRFCSVGAGFGGEEYLLVGKVKELALIEPSAFCYEFLKNRFPQETIVSPKAMQHFYSENKYEFIYTSAPTHWMYFHPIRGVPEDFLKFLSDYLNQGGVFIVRAYGGVHSRDILGQRLFYQSIIKTLAPRYVIQAGYFGFKDHQSLLVITENNYKCDSNFNNFVKELSNFEGEMVVLNNRFLKPTRQNSLRQLLVSIRLLFYIPIKLMRDLIKSIKSIVRDIKVNLYT